jgi:DedD protein
MSYTSGAAMDQRGLRDVERWRDKIEVRLDNRQVFFLFFGSALVACLLFVLGVIVGKRLESRGRAIAPEVEDPLALLDKVATTPRTTQSPAVTFPQALFGGKNAQSSAKKTDLKLVPSVGEPDKVAAKPAEIAKTNEAAPAVPATTKPATSKQVAALEKPAEPAKPASAVSATTKPATSKLVAALDKPTEPAKPASATKTAEAKPPVAAKPVAATAPATRPTPAPASGKAAPVAAANKPIVADPPVAKGPVPVIGAAATDSAKGKLRFTLQISAFQDRAEAEAFAGKLGAEKTYITTSQVPGKGTWYRVRVGDFASAKDAIAGKLAFEKQHGVIAYVTQR